MAKLEIPTVTKTLNIDGSQTYTYMIEERLVSELKLTWSEIMDPSVFWVDKVKQWVHDCTDKLKEGQSNDQTIEDQELQKP
jgi:hypothetical protein